MYTTECKIGKIVKIEGITILVEVTEKNVADKVLIKMGIGNYVVSINKFIYATLPSCKRVISRITKIIDRSLFYEQNIFSDNSNDKILIEADLVGIYDDITKRFDYGINTFPIIGSEIFALNNEIYETMLCNSTNYLLEVGRSYNDSNVSIYANPDILFGKHLGVFGNTGTGKTCTVASVIQGLKRRIKSCNNISVNLSPKIIILDSNNEYSTAFSSSDYKVRIIEKEELNLPHYNLSFTEYYKFLGASQGVQAPVLKEAISGLKDKYGKFKLIDLPTKIEDVITKRSNNNNFSFNQWYGWCSTLINRIDKIVEDERISNIIDSSVVPDTVQQIINSDDEIFIINADFDKDELDVIMFLFSKLLFKYAARMRDENQRCNLLVLFEEAHRYINEEDSEEYKLGNLYIERLAREGRKYGIGLIISSQRPSELSKTVLSQCNSFIIHRITNKNDLEFVNKVLSLNNQGLLKYISGLEKQYAVALGEAFSYSDIIKICTADPRPRSDDPEVINNWVDRFEANNNGEKELFEEIAAVLE